MSYLLKENNMLPSVLLLSIMTQGKSHLAYL